MQIPRGKGVSGNKVITPLVLAAFTSMLVLNVLYSPEINTNVAISSVYEGITDDQEVQVLTRNRERAKFRFATILTEPRKYYCTMLASAAMNNISIDVFGWGDEKLSGTKGWWRKLLWFREMSRSYDPEDVVVFVDAGDTLFNTGVDEIRAAYIATAATQRLKQSTEFIWSAERNCGMRTLTRSECQTLHNIPAGISTPYRWLNSGGWAGRAGAAKYLFDTVDEDRNGRTKQADQAFIAESHVKRGWKHRHGLDYSQTLFMSMYRSEKDICGWPDIQPPLRNCRTNSTPAVFHFNAGSKAPETFEKVLHETHWWKEFDTPEGRRKVSEFKVNVSGNAVPIKDLCPTGYGLVENRDVSRILAQIGVKSSGKPRLISPPPGADVKESGV
eukprot:TRINITY_DN1974_c2_g1_i2.p1 TRINITY_DN1974_c2_g1~~TRINITY_DN1974_c2_g1_i2.p1  ORF type:complete len:403 (+),score=46.23 TRINITY_DN1974_c2_g1_i2:49-1209(+)